MTITSIISSIVVGLIIGALGRQVVPGRQPIPIWLTIVVGIVAAFVGNAIAAAFGYSNANGGIAWIAIILQIAVAAVGVAITARAYSNRGVRR